MLGVRTAIGYVKFLAQAANLLVDWLLWTKLLNPKLSPGVLQATSLQDTSLLHSTFFSVAAAQVMCGHSLAIPDFRMHIGTGRIFFRPTLCSVLQKGPPCANHKPIVLPPRNINFSETCFFKQLAMSKNTWMMVNHMVSKKKMAWHRQKGENRLCSWA